MGDEPPFIDCYCQNQLISACIQVLPCGNKSRGELCLPESTQKEAAMAIGRQNYLSGKYSIRHTRVSCEHIGPTASVSTAHPSPTTTTRCSLGVEAPA